MRNLHLLWVPCFGEAWSFFRSLLSNAGRKNGQVRALYLLTAFFLGGKRGPTKETVFLDFWEVPFSRKGPVRTNGASIESGSFGKGCRNTKAYWFDMCVSLRMPHGPNVCLHALCTVGNQPNSPINYDPLTWQYTQSSLRPNKGGLPNWLFCLEGFKEKPKGSPASYHP